MKIIDAQGQTYSVQDNQEFQPITLEVQLASTGSGQFGKPVQAIIDSGSSHIIVPRKLLPQASDHSQPLASVKTLTADGDVSDQQQVLIDLRLQNLLFSSVPAIIMNEGEMLLLGLNVLRHLDVQIKGGKLVFLGFNSKSTEMTSASSNGIAMKQPSMKDMIAAVVNES